MIDDSYAGDISESEAWDLLAEDLSAMLVDVRTPAEWAYVGVPDVSRLGKQVVFVPWLDFPSMQLNPFFGQQLIQAGIGKGQPLLFLCRSGIRSKAAAKEMTRLGFSPCFNLREGFEGNLDAQKHRGSTGGWKVSGLPWVQT